MPSFNTRLEEQFTILQKRAEKHNAEVEEARQQQTSSQQKKSLLTVSSAGKWGLENFPLTVRSLSLSLSLSLSADVPTKSHVVSSKSNC